jgi:hypothetical protein
MHSSIYCIFSLFLVWGYYKDNNQLIRTIFVWKHAFIEVSVKEWNGCIADVCLVF